MKYYYLTDESEKSLAPFFSKMVLSASLACVVIVGICVLIFWPRLPLGGYLIADKVPFVFFLIFGATLIVSCYINIYCGRGETIPRFYFIRNQTDIPTFERELDFLRYGLIQFVLHAFILLLPFLPLLVLAASVSIIPLVTFLQAVMIIYSASLLCRLFAFMIYLFGGRLSTAGYLAARGLMIFFLFGTLFFQSAINPLQVLYMMNQSPQISGWHFVFHLVIVYSAILLLTVINHRLVRRHMKSEMTS
jgi:hypothetical protein